MEPCSSEEGTPHPFNSTGWLPIESDEKLGEVRIWACCCLAKEAARLLLAATAAAAAAITAAVAGLRCSPHGEMGKLVISIAAQNGKRQKIKTTIVYILCVSALHQLDNHQEHRFVHSCAHSPIS